MNQFGKVVSYVVCFIFPLGYDLTIHIKSVHCDSIEFYNPDDINRLFSPPINFNAQFDQIELESVPTNVFFYFITKLHHDKSACLQNFC